MKKVARLAALALVLAASSAWAIPPHVPVYVGDYCDFEGAGSGCLYWQNGVLWKTTCTCINGHWVRT